MRIFPRSRIINFLLIVLGVAIVGTIFAPPRGARHNARRSSCQSNLKQIALGFKQYTQDYDEKFPLIAGGAVPSTYTDDKGDYGWGDSLQPYLKSPQIFQCPSEPSSPSSPLLSLDPQFTDYWFNGHMAQVNEQDVSESSMTFLLGDGNGGSEQCDSRYSLKSIPKVWRTKEDSPMYRHLDGANYAFVDGHVKWLQPKRVPDGTAGEKVFGFKPGKMPQRAQRKEIQ